MNIKLTAKEHVFLISFLPDKGAKEIMKYIFRLLQQLENERNDEQEITINAEKELILYIYKVLGTKPQNLTTVMIRGIKEKLLRQIQDQEILIELQKIDIENNEQLEEIINANYNDLYAMK